MSDLAVPTQEELLAALETRLLSLEVLHLELTTIAGMLQRLAAPREPAPAERWEDEGGSVQASTEGDGTYL